MIAEPGTTARPITPNNPRERKHPTPGSFSASLCKPLAQRGPAIGPACARGRLHRKPRTPSLRAEFLRQHENLARALDLGPAAVPFGDHSLQYLSTRYAFKPGLNGGIKSRLNGPGIADASETARPLRFQRRYWDKA